MKTTRRTDYIVTCSFCHGQVKIRNLQLHFADDCPDAPAIPEGQRICSKCQTMKALADMTKDSNTRTGYGNSCKACVLDIYHNWRNLKKAGELPPSSATPVRRPSRWVLRPCKYCGELFNWEERRHHVRRCDKHPGGRYRLPPEANPLDMVAMLEASKRKTLEEEYKSGQLRSHYGIDIDDFNRMFAAQHGLCAICNQPPRETRNPKTNCLFVDHDHNTGNVRALLCPSCNHMLGNARDSQAVLRAAADYLDIHGSVGYLTSKQAEHAESSSHDPSRVVVPMSHIPVLRVPFKKTLVRRHKA